MRASVFFYILILMLNLPIQTASFFETWHHVQTHHHKSTTAHEHDHDHEDRDHEDRDHEDRDHEDRDHEDRDHEDRDHENRDHEDRDHEDRDHEDRDHEDSDHEDHDHEDSQASAALEAPSQQPASDSQSTHSHEQDFWGLFSDLGIGSRPWLSESLAFVVQALVPFEQNELVCKTFCQGLFRPPIA